MTDKRDQPRDRRDDYSSDEDVEFVRRRDRTPPSTQPNKRYDLSAFRAAEELMRVNKQGPSLRRETARQAPDSGGAFNDCLNVGENVKEDRVQGTYFKPREARVKTLPLMANPARPSTTRPHDFVRKDELERNYDRDAEGALDRSSRGASTSPVIPPDSLEAHQRIIDTQARLIAASQKQLIDLQN